MRISVVGAAGTSFIEAVIPVLRMEVREATSEDAKAV
jgi:putative lipoic acid-binding regulatory protein